MAEGLEPAAETSASTCTWKREPRSVIFEIARDGMCIVNECFQNGGFSGVDVNEAASSVYGALHAKMDCSGQILVSVDTNINYKDFSFQFDHYVCIGGNSDGPEKPPKYMLFESKQFPNYFITWSLSTDMPDNAVDSTCANNVVKCEFLEKTGDLPSIKISTTGSILEPSDPKAKRYVWVVPVDNQNQVQFALRAFDQHYYLVFKQKTGETMMVPNDPQNADPELKIFRLHSLS